MTASTSECSTTTPARPNSVFAWMMRAFSLRFWRNHDFTESWKAFTTVLAAGYSPWVIANEVFYNQMAGQKRWEFARLLAEVRSIKPRVILEIGVAAGGTLCAWPQVSAAQATVLGIDLNIRTKSSLGQSFPPETVETRVRSYLKPEQTAHFIWGDSHDPDTRSRVLRILDGRKIDFLFIDGDHSYEGVKADFLDFSPLVRDGGLIAFHDIVPDHKTRFNIDTGAWAGGVPDFWREVRRQCRHGEAKTFIEDHNQDSCGIGVVRCSATLVRSIRADCMKPRL